MATLQTALAAIRTSSAEASPTQREQPRLEAERVALSAALAESEQSEAAAAASHAALEDADLLKVGHNVKYDLKVLARHGVTVRGPVFDTMVAHYLLDPEASHKLDDVSSFHLNYRPQPITDLIGTGKNALTMDQVSEK